ncbi:MAG: SpoIIE family protein phosphatase [Leptospiraceae bacterium]|nr:SpoIIE family protein phosphatase [Leptospiraceae bacterium]
MRIILFLSLMAQPAFGIIENATIALPDRTPVSLRGFWWFTAPGISQPLRVDKEWRLQGIHNLPKASYTLKILIPDRLKTGDFGLMLPPVSAAIKIRLNGFTVAEKGEVNKVYRYPLNSSEAFAWYPVKLEYLAAGAVQQLEIEITGFQGGGGLYGNAHLYFGGIEEIRSKYNQIFLATAVLAAAIMMIALFHFALVPDRNYRRANLHYVLLSLAMACHILGINGLGYYLINDFLFNAALIHLIIAAFPFALVGFSLRYFKLKFPLIRKLAYGYGGLMAAVLVGCALSPEVIPYYLRYGLPTGFVAMSVALAFAVFASIRGILSGVEGAKIVLFGFVIYAAAVLNDILFYFSYAISIKLADAGFLAAVICIAVALAGRLQRAAQEKEELREWRREISLAAQIQNLSLPARSLTTPHLQISTLFQPMKIIGGDFFAFHEISDRVTGVFIADVSGHGIAAALLVNTIKSVFLQQKQYASEPAQLLRNMNQALYPHLQEQFVTAAYCVLDFSQNKVRVAQAGHPPIYFIRASDARIEKVKPRGRFFGFSEDLQYETAELDLRAYKRVFLYSDGIIEAGAVSGVPYSGARLEHFLTSAAAFSGERFLRELERDIYRISQNPINTDDDSSCIVVDFKAA